MARLDAEDENAYSSIEGPTPNVMSASIPGGQEELTEDVSDAIENACKSHT